MNANSSPSASAKDTRKRRQRGGASAALMAAAAGFLLLGSQAPACAQEQAAAQPTPAVLKQHELHFFYRSSTVRFTCNALQGRVASVLLALGARDDVAVTVNGCDIMLTPQRPGDMWDNTSGRQNRPDRWRTSSERLRGRTSVPEQTAHVRVRAMMPIEVTDEVLEEIKRDKSRRELVSRVTGDPAAGLNDPIVFPAQRRHVTLSQRTLDLRPEECELLEQMSDAIFRELDIRLVSRGSTCRDRRSRMSPHMTVEALMPIFGETPQIAPAEDDGDVETGEPAAPESAEGVESAEATSVTPSQ